MSGFDSGSGPPPLPKQGSYAQDRDDKSVDEIEQQPTPDLTSSELTNNINNETDNTSITNHCNAPFIIPPESVASDALADIRERRRHEYESAKKNMDGSQTCSKLIVSRDSQYTLDSTSSCGIMSMEAILRVLLVMQKRDTLTLGMLDDVVRVASGYTLPNHLDVTDIITKIDRYSTMLQDTNVVSSSVARLPDLLKMLKEERGRGPCGFFITKTPEIIAIIPKDNNVFYLFDSHPRPDHDGAAFVIFDNSNQLLTYLRQLLPALEDVPEIYNLMNVDVIRLKPESERPAEIPAISFDRLTATVLKARVRELEDDNRRLTAELNKKDQDHSLVMSSLQEQITQLQTKMQQMGQSQASSSSQYHRENSDSQGFQQQKRKNNSKGKYKKNQYNKGNNNYQNDWHGGKKNGAIDVHNQPLSYASVASNSNNSGYQSKNANGHPQSQNTTQRARPSSQADNYDDANAMAIANAQMELSADEQFERDRLFAFQLSAQQDSFECDLCVETYDLGYIHISECGHRCCRECGGRSLIEQINTRKWPLRCFETDCRHEIMPYEVETSLDQDMLKKYSDLSLEMGLLTCKGLCQCQQPDCKGVAILEDTTHFICPQCHYEYCTKCKCKWHANTTCAKYQEWNKDNAGADDAFAQMLRNRDFMQCPKCRNGVQKSEGCNHMTCRCGHQFWYCCGGDYRGLHRPGCGRSDMAFDMAH